MASPAIPTFEQFKARQNGNPGQDWFAQHAPPSDDWFAAHAPSAIHPNPSDSSPAIDYAALAEQARHAAPVDYSALAAQARQGSAPPPPPGAQPISATPPPPPGAKPIGQALFDDPVVAPTPTRGKALFDDPPVGMQANAPGPWEKYQQSGGAAGAAGAPWLKYQAASAAPSNPNDSNDWFAAHAPAEPKSWSDQAESFLTGLVPDTAKGLYHTVLSAFPNVDLTGEDARHAKELVDKGDYIGAAKHIATKAVEATPGGKILTGAIHNAIDETHNAAVAYKRGDTATAANHLSRAIPVIGPMMGGLADTGAGTPEVRDDQGNIVQPATQGDPARMLGQIAGMALAPKAIEGAVEAAPAVAAVAKGAAKGAKEGAVSPTPVHGHSVLAQAARAFGVDKVPAPIAQAVIGRYGAQALLGPFIGPEAAAMGGEVVGAAAPIVRGAWRGAKQGLKDYNLANADQGTPIWKEDPGVPPSVELSKFPLGPDPQPKLPSGRSVGPIAAPETPARVPWWQQAQQPSDAVAAAPQEAPLPQPQPALPSGRKVGGIANQTPEPTTAPAQAAPAPTPNPTADLSLYGVPFDKLSPELQKLALDAAERAKNPPPKAQAAPVDLAAPPSVEQAPEAVAKSRTLQQIMDDEWAAGRDPRTGRPIITAQAPDPPAQNVPPGSVPADPALVHAPGDAVVPGNGRDQLYTDIGAELGARIGDNAALKDPAAAAWLRENRGITGQRFLDATPAEREAWLKLERHPTLRRSRWGGFSKTAPPGTPKYIERVHKFAALLDAQPRYSEPGIPPSPETPRNPYR